MVSVSQPRSLWLLLVLIIRGFRVAVSVVMATVADCPWDPCRAVLCNAALNDRPYSQDADRGRDSFTKGTLEGTPAIPALK